MFRRNDRPWTARSGRAIIALSICVGSAAASETTRTAEIPANPRVYQSSVSIMGVDAISFEVSSPRIPASELEKVLQAPRVLETLNRKHLSDLGSLNVARACRIGPVFLDPGTYQLGLEISPERDMNLTLTSSAPAQSNQPSETISVETVAAGKTIRIALSASATSGAVPVVTIAMLPSDDLEGFAIELRVGKIRGVTSIDFSAERLVIAMNNTAHDLLNPDDLDARIDAQTAALALGLARRANAMTSGSNPLILDTYALSLFHAGNAKEAAITQRKAIRNLEPELESERDAMVARLRAYQMAGAR